MHYLTYDLGRVQGTRTYAPGRDSRNITVRCTCGWAHADTLFACEQRGAIHMGAFRRELREWNDPDRRAVMPGHSYGRVEQAA
jgi:hypothetical protein